MTQTGVTIQKNWFKKKIFQVMLNIFYILSAKKRNFLAEGGRTPPPPLIGDMSLKTFLRPSLSLNL